MWKAIKYIFYKAYKFYKYEMGDKKPEFMGILVVYALLSLFLVSILGFTGFFTNLNKQIWLISVIIFLAVWLYIFYNKGKWKEIIKEFENESEKARKRGRILCILAVVFTILLFLSTLVVVYIRSQSS